MPQTFRLIAALVALSSWNLEAADTFAPKLDKAKLEQYVRYTEAYVPHVKLVIDDPMPSGVEGFSRVLVHASMGAQKAGDILYYVGPDGTTFLKGSLFSLNENPFLDNVQHLPSNGPSFGPANAKVTLVIFSDFECPYCREFARTVRDNLPKKYPNEVRVVFEDFPLEAIHPWARSAAEAAHCIAGQKTSGFWAFHDWIFEHQGEINPSNLRDKVLTFGKEQALDVGKLSTCMDSHVTASVVAENITAGQKVLVQQTPTEFVNGRMVSGAVSWNGLDALIQLELNRPKEIPGPSESK